METDKKEPENNIYLEATLKMDETLQKFKRQTRAKLARSEQSARNVILK